MEVFDKLALAMRRHEPVHSHRTKSRRFELMDLMEMYSRQSILELDASTDGKKWSHLKPDAERKFKVSLLEIDRLLGRRNDAFYYSEDPVLGQIDATTTPPVPAVEAEVPVEEKATS